MGNRLDGLANLSSVYARRQFSHSRPSLTTSPGTRLGRECGREEEEEDESESGTVLYSTPLQAILSFCPHLTLGCDRAASSAHESPRALVERQMLFIQFGAGGRGGEVFLTLTPTTRVAIKAGLQGHRVAVLTCPPGHLHPPAATPLPACHLNKQCFYRALGKASLSLSGS